jgi:hypothetical protein
VSCADCVPDPLIDVIGGEFNEVRSRSFAASMSDELSKVLLMLKCVTTIKVELSQP